jgi:lysophospholipase L1-like esterase
MMARMATASGALMGLRTRALALLVLGWAAPAVAQTPAIELRADDRIALVGNTMAERMQLFNHFETLLMTRFPDLRLTVRNLGWSGDTITLQPRPLNFGTTPTHLYREKADVVIAFFGLNESFAGEPGLQQFEHDLDAYLRAQAAARYNGASAPRLVLVSPIAHERLDRLKRVDTTARNRELERYTDAMRRVASARGVAFADVFTPTRRLMAAGTRPLTINGIHVNEDGDRLVARLLLGALGYGQGLRAATPAEVKRLDGLRALIRDKNQQFFYRWRPVNGEYVYGRRLEPFGSVNFPGEMQRLDEMVAERERRIWSRATAVAGLTYPADGLSVTTTGTR